MNKFVKYSRRTFLVIYPLLCLSAGGSAVASILIDTFSQVENGLQFVSATPADMTSFSFSEQPGSAPGFTQVLGGYRELSISDVAGDLSEEVTAVVADGELSFNNDSTITSKLQVKWNGPGSMGLGGINFTGNKLDSIAIDFASTNPGLSATLGILDTNNKLSEATYTFEAGATCSSDKVLYVFNQEDFDQIKNPCKALFTPGADFTKVNEVALTLQPDPSLLTPPSGLDPVIESAEVVKEIPEPTTSILTFVGLAAFGAIIKRRKVESN